MRDRPACHLCDYRLAGSHRRCDRLLCEEHRHSHSSGVSNLPDGRPTWKVDYCPEHAQSERQLPLET